VSQLSSADVTTGATNTEIAEAEAEGVVDEVRQGLLDELTGRLGDGVVASHIRPLDDLWVRVDRGVWAESAVLLQSLGFRWFSYLSAIDWLPSPYGRDMDAQEDVEVLGVEPKVPGPIQQGYAGGETRFQVIARVLDTTRALGLHLKVDVPDDDLRVDTWTDTYLGANWHERECHEMFGIDFTGHPNLTKLYLPADFQGFPLRKDFPLLARRVRPWPGIVDVEPLPGGAGDDEGEGE
jgi:NADH-quinone oxidoreductase subunit C